jgi:hypothetical protein
MQTLRAAGLKRPYAMDWIGATTATKDATISDANLAAIIGGILVFRDPIGIGAPAIVGRVIAGAAFMPAPVRAGRAAQRLARHRGERPPRPPRLLWTSPCTGQSRAPPAAFDPVLKS